MSKDHSFKRGSRQKDSTIIKFTKKHPLLVGVIISAIITPLILAMVGPLFDIVKEQVTYILKHDPDQVVIIRALDGNNQTVQTNGKTPSPRITFFFEAYKGKTNTLDTNPNFECKIDQQLF